VNIGWFRWWSPVFNGDVRELIVFSGTYTVPSFINHAILAFANVWGIFMYHAILAFGGCVGHMHVPNFSSIVGLTRIGSADSRFG
jgi:hypothetical protein